jgi:glucokinase
MVYARENVAIGIDIGGTKIAGGLVNLETGHLLARQEIATPVRRGGLAVLDDTVGMAARLHNEATTRGVHPAGIGIGLCELVDLAGNVTSAQTFDWRDLPVQARLAEVAAPVVIESDARVPALAEARFGAGRPYHLFIYLTVGTGISYSLVQEGRPFAGARGNALVLASMPLTTRCTACGTLLHPVLEEIASGPMLVARYNRTSGAAVTRAEEVLAAVTAESQVATEIVAEAGEALGTSVGFLINVLDPEAIIVGGGLGLAGGLYWERFVASTREHIYADNARQLPILRAALGADAGLIGAAVSIQTIARSDAVPDVTDAV